MGNTLSKTLAPAQRSRESEFPPTEEWNELALTKELRTF